MTTPTWWGCPTMPPRKPHLRRYPAPPGSSQPYIWHCKYLGASGASDTPVGAFGLCLIRSARLGCQLPPLPPPSAYVAGIYEAMAQGGAER